MMKSSSPSSLPKRSSHDVQQSSTNNSISPSTIPHSKSESTFKPTLVSLIDDEKPNQPTNASTNTTTTAIIGNNSTTITNGNSSNSQPTISINGNVIVNNSIILSERKTNNSTVVNTNSNAKIVELGVEESSPSINPSIPQQVAHAVVNSIVNSNTVTSNRRIHSFKNTSIQRIIDLESNLIALSDRTIFGNRSDTILEEEITYSYLKDYYYNNDQPISIDGQDELPINKKIEPYSPSFSYSFKEDQRARMLFFFSLLISCCLCLIPPFMMFASVPCCVMYWCTDLVKFKSRRAKIYATLLYYLSVTFSLVCFIIFVIIIPLSLISTLKS